MLQNTIRKILWINSGTNNYTKEKERRKKERKETKRTHAHTYRLKMSRM